MYGHSCQACDFKKASQDECLSASSVDEGGYRGSIHPYQEQDLAKFFLLGSVASYPYLPIITIHVGEIASEMPLLSTLVTLVSCSHFRHCGPGCVPPPLTHPLPRLRQAGQSCCAGAHRRGQWPGAVAWAPLLGPEGPFVPGLILVLQVPGVID